MKTLYTRIVGIILLIILISSLVGFMVSNYYYHFHQKSKNDQKITAMLQEVTSYLENQKSLEINPYLTNLGDLGYQFLLIDPNNKKKFFGQPFRESTLEQKIIDSVKSGTAYHGIQQFPPYLFITGFFDNIIENTVGTSFHIDGETYALFMRADSKTHFGELRSYFTNLIFLTIIFSILLILIGTRFIVKPITNLTAATKKIAQGTFDVALQTTRKDEIGTLSNNFAHMAKKLKQLDHMRQQFVANVSHEIQTPLSSIQGFAQTLHRKDLTEKEREQYLVVIEKESQRLSQLSKQLLLLSSLDREEISLEKTNVHLAKQIQEVIFMTEWHWREKNLSIEMDLSPIVISGDANLLYQVWINLMTNCMKYNREGGSIKIQITTTKEDIWIYFTDTGIGMTEQEQKHIFERFYKADRARTRDLDGNSSGLGLAIVEKIIHLHAGEIQVKSQINEGTTFSIRLPKL